MHRYHVQGRSGEWVTFAATLLSLGLAYVLHLVLQPYEFIFNRWWIETPSILAIFGLLQLGYNRVLWNRRPFGLIPSIHIPDISGTWQGDVKSSYDEFTTPTKVTVNIEQNASRIRIHLDAPESTSESVTASLLRVRETEQFSLAYQFLNRPRAEAISTMNIHLGTAELTIDLQTGRLWGNYYTGRGRETYGSVDLTK